ncbi:serine hydrolase [Robiginitalea sp. SC105]|uniref:serine hydrolase n=1 Tax=Robiginitalea sp. SC105 TaxID=2762332 RepID=UPI001639A2C2|nr:serine hydrolase [Robiginitalea sp. SC105]MBC2838550.1 serine hydrolase [Robiginitalea sp. SC105]
MKQYLGIAFLLLWTVLRAQPELPLKTDSFRPLEHWADKALATHLNREVSAHPEWSSLVQDKKMAIGLVDLRDPEKPRFASVNGNHMMYAASLPKIAILLAVMDAIDKKEITESGDIRRDMRLMISKSDNQASTRLIDLLGYEKIEAVMTDPRYVLYDESKGGGLWVGKRYGSGGGTNREPLKNLSHAATASQVCRFYYLMAYGQLIDPRRSSQMLQIMEKPELHHKFVNTLTVIAPGARIFRKSGSWRTYHSDSALVWGTSRDRRYILVALIDDPEGERIARDLVRPMESVLKRTTATR